jgi:hypothetical protein
MDVSGRILPHWTPAIHAAMTEADIGPNIINHFGMTFSKQNKQTLTSGVPSD